MEIKKHYDWGAPPAQWLKRPADAPPLKRPGSSAVLTHNPPVAYLEIRRLSKRQKIPPKTLGRRELAGIVTLDESAITFKTDKGPLVLAIERAPGRYCCHCNERLPDDDQSPWPGEAARQHVAAKHAGKDSPDKENPSGYCRVNAYECIAPDDFVTRGA